MTAKQLLELSEQRAHMNLAVSVEYRQTLEWVKLALKDGLTSKAEMIQEIDRVLAHGLVTE